MPSFLSFLIILQFIQVKYRVKEQDKDKNGWNVLCTLCSVGALIPSINYDLPPATQLYTERIISPGTQLYTDRG